MSNCEGYRAILNVSGRQTLWGVDLFVTLINVVFPGPFSTSSACTMTQVSRTGFIINPMAGGGLPKNDLAAIENLRRELNADVAFTHPLSGAMKCLPGLRQYDSLWIAGGDGTLSQIVNRLVEGSDNNPDERLPVIHLLPTGTGNDFAFALGIDGAVEVTGAELRIGEQVEVDCGMVEWRDEGESEYRRHAFINAMGIGLDAAVAIRAEKLKRRFGKSSYHLAALLALAGLHPSAARMVLDGTPSERRILMLSICNGPRAGAGFFLTPDAELDDGLLDVCAVDSVGFVRALRFLPKVKEGRHQGIPEVMLSRAREVDIRFGRPLPMHIDGEVISQGVTDASIMLSTQRLRFAVTG